VSATGDDLARPRIGNGDHPMFDDVFESFRSTPSPKRPALCRVLVLGASGIGPTLPNIEWAADIGMLPSDAPGFLKTLVALVNVSWAASSKKGLATLGGLRLRIDPLGRAVRSNRPHAIGHVAAEEPMGVRTHRAHLGTLSAVLRQSAHGAAMSGFRPASSSRSVSPV
jgi:hypothetical protein